MTACIDCGIDHGPMFLTPAGWVCECCMVDRRNAEYDESGYKKKKAPVLLVVASTVALLVIIAIGVCHALGWR